MLSAVSQNTLKLFMKSVCAFLRGCSLCLLFSLFVSVRSEEALEFRKKFAKNGPTALITHGANPGLVSHFVKQGLLNIAKDTGLAFTVPKTRAEWAELAQKLDIKTIHISERDTQASASVIKHDQEFVNTWSIEGYVEEGKQPAELGWGTHEKHWPVDGKTHDNGWSVTLHTHTLFHFFLPFKLRVNDDKTLIDRRTASQWT